MSGSAPESTQPRSPSREQLRRQMIDALREVAGRLGPNVSLRTFAAESGLSSTRVYRWFGSWGQLLIEAGLPARGDRTDSLAVYTKCDLLEAMQAVVARQGARLSQATFCREMGISPGPIRRLFGGWGGLREAVGLDPQTPHPSRPRFTPSELVQTLRDLVSEHGDMTLPEFCRRLGSSRQVVYGRSSWNELRSLAGLLPAPRRYSKDEIRQHLKRLIDERGDVTQSAFCRELHICAATISRHGRWADLRRELKLPPQGCIGRPRWETLLIGDLFDPLREIPPLTPPA